MHKRKLAAIILAASVAQGLVYPSLSMAQDTQMQDIPVYDAAQVAAQHESETDGADQGTGQAQDQQAGATGTDSEGTDGTESPHQPEGTDIGSSQPADGTGNDAAATEESNPSQSEAPETATTDEDGEQGAADEQRSAETKDDKTAKDGVTPPSDDYTGWVEHDGKRYWFDKGVQARDKEVYDRQSDAWYYFDANGEMLKDTNKDLPGKTVRYDEHGHMVKGEKRIGNDDYYFDMQTGAMARNKDVFLRAGKGRWVRYDGNGHMIKGREHCHNGGWYYFEADGTMAKGMKHISSNGGKWVYYDWTTGKMAHGEKYVNYDAEHTGWYYFHNQTGAMQYEFVYHRNADKWVYYHKTTGKMLYGEHYINKGWYYMHPKTGALAKGFTTVKGKRVYYDPQSSRMVHGPAVISGRPYYFDKTTGRQHGKQEIINKLVSVARSLRGKHPDCPGALAINGGIVCPHGPCMAFVWYVFHSAGYDVFLCNGGSVNGKQSGWPQHNYDWYARRGRISNTPKVGDIVFWKFRDATWATSASHAGFVVSVAPGRVTIVDAAFTNIAERTISWGLYPATPQYATPFYG